MNGGEEGGGRIIISGNISGISQTKTLLKTEHEKKITFLCQQSRRVQIFRRTIRTLIM